jgi:uncharacterized protein (DUF1800 family)
MESLRSPLAVILCCTLCFPASLGFAQQIPSSKDPAAGKTKARPEYRSTQLRGDERILHALNRFTFGPRPGDLEAVRAEGLDRWFDRQLKPASIDEADLKARLAEFPEMQWNTVDLLYRLPSNGEIRQAMNTGKIPIPAEGTLHAIYENQIYRLQAKKAEQAGGQGNNGQGKLQLASDGSMVKTDAQVGAAMGQDPAGTGSSASMGGGSRPAGMPQQPVVKVQIAEKLPSGAKARPLFSAPCGTTKVVPFQNPTVATGCQTATSEAGSAMSGAGSMMNGSGSGAGSMEMNAAADAQPQFDQAAIADLLALGPEQRVAQLAAMQPAKFEEFVKALRPVERVKLNAGLSPELKLTVRALENPERTVGEDLLAERLTRDIYSNAQLDEVMTDFWLNHFNVYLRKNEQTPYYLVSYARDTIRPRALGKFEDLLEAVAHSPAMLAYLDNAESIGPESPAAVRAEMAAAKRPDAKKKPHQGLNENYARELMELHTLGVNGGYTQADVTQVARVLTGWGIERPQVEAVFSFNPNRHEPGTKKVLGKKIKENGEMEGRELLHMLASSPATAQFISRKLAVRFVADDPPQALVDRMAKSYMSSGGDIAVVLRTLFHSPEFWSTATYRAKVKTPLEFVVSAARASNASIDNLLPLENNLRQMGMPVYGAIPPTGYDWKSPAWVSTGALVDRMNFALTLAANRLPGVTVNWAQAAGSTDATSAETEEMRLEPLIVAGGVSVSTRSAALQQFAAQTAQNSAMARPVAAMRNKRAPNATAIEKQDQVLAGLLIGSPEFQRR